MKLEQFDGIWNHFFREDGVAKIAGLYADKTRDFSNFKDQAEDLAGSASTYQDVTKIRKLYHLSISNQKIYNEIESKIIMFRLKSGKMILFF